MQQRNYLARHPMPGQQGAGAPPELKAPVPPQGFAVARTRRCRGAEQGP